MAGAALVNAWRARDAERRHPPLGRFLEVEGVRLHYLERGQGDALVLLHGNGSMIEDFAASGLLDLAADSHRTIAFDRPGYGHSSRPRGKLWTPEEQADLLAAALQRLGIERAIVLGHSWGTFVAVTMAARHPELVRGLVLASGYYFPTLRSDVIFFSPPGIPVIGDLIRYTIAPFLARLILPRIIRKIFAPAAIPAKFAGFPTEMCLRPSQLRASAVESALMIPSAVRARSYYPQLKLPVVIVAGEGDEVANVERQSARLHRALSAGVLHRMPGAGHMIHHTAPALVMAAIAEASGLSRGDALERRPRLRLPRPWRAPASRTRL